ncbi:transposase domain-containing protein [Streptosporangium sp. NPDC002721]|uniref:transposase domain-containing protein n=1 Tax=Streptosporangium sp. NPDC002721 TaxID=3366188 RepID=UPI00368793E6
MARAGQSRSRIAHPRDHIALGTLVSMFPPSMVRAAVEQAGAKERRSRTLTAQLVTYYVLACVLWHEHSHEEVWARLTMGLAWLNNTRLGDDVRPPVSSSISDAKHRLGSEPLTLLLKYAAVPLLGDAAGRWRDRAVVAVDGFGLRAQPTKANQERLSGPPSDTGTEAFPQVRVMVGADCRTGTIAAARVEGHTADESASFRRLVAAFGPGTVLAVAPRLFSPAHHSAATARGAALISLAPRSVSFPVVAPLPDGSWISHLGSPPGRTGRPVRVRVAGHGPGTEEGHLVSSVLDPDEASAAELADTYASRWSSRSFLTCLRPGGQADTEIVLRSKRPDGAFQEAWAALAVYQGLRTMIVKAQAAGIHTVADRLL